MSDQYKPISCAVHDEYEIAIMHKKHLNIRWCDDAGQQHDTSVLPVDIVVKNKEEFLIANASDNNVLSIRLDKIKLVK